jgi:uncharacterized protein
MAITTLENMIHWRVIRMVCYNQAEVKSMESTGKCAESAFEGGLTSCIEGVELRIAASFKERVREFLGDSLRDLRIFGSRARGEGHHESDLDVFVLIDAKNAYRRRRIIDIAYDVSLETDFIAPLSPLVMDEKEFLSFQKRERRLVRDIMSEGLPI